MNFDFSMSNLLHGFETVNYADVLLSFVFSLLAGLLIFFIYRITYSGVLYSRSFGLSLVAVTLITNISILAVTQNVVLSLGMVGALSIVRFRAAVKEPMEIAFLFWAISEGIVIAAGMVPVAIAGAVFVSAVLLLARVKGPAATPYIIVLHAKDDASCDAAMKMLSEKAKKTALKSKTVRPDGIELTAEIRVGKKEGELVREISTIPGVGDVSFVSYNGDYMA